MGRGLGVVLALVVAGCFVDTGGGASATKDAMNEVTSGDAGATSGELPGGSTCAGACLSGETTAPAPTTSGEEVTGSSTSADATTGGPTGAGPGVFMQDAPLNLPGAYAPVAGRFDADMLGDLVVTSRDLMAPNLYVLHGPTIDVPETIMSVAATAIEMVDFDGDLDLDLMIVAPGNPAHAHMYRQDMGLVKIGQIGLPTNCVAPRELGFAYLNDDTEVDAVLACDAAGVIVLPGEGNGMFAGALQIDVEGAAGGITAADVGGTTAADIVYIDTGKHTVVFLAGVGDFLPNMDQTATFPVEMPTGITVGHVDMDAYADVAVSSATGTCPVILGSADAPVAGAPYACGAGALDIHLPDLDVDGIVDVVTVHGQELHVGFGLGDGTFSAPDVYPGGPNSIQAGIVDVDGDGRLDIAVTAQDTLTLYRQVP